MRIEEAKGVLYTLARGIDPRDGKMRAYDDVCNDVEVVRALYIVLSYLDYRYGWPSTDPYLKDLVNSYRREITCDETRGWTEDEEDILVRMFREGYEKRAICEELSRSEDGIAEKLMELGVIESPIHFLKR